MAKVKLRATGGLNKDVDPNFLPEGDYIEASNIVTDTSTSGNAGSIKMLESIKATGASFSGTIKATCQDPDGNIYVLEKTNSTNSTLYKIVPPFNSGDKSTVLTYEHISVPSDSFIPDLRILGDVLMWNYEGAGILLSYNLTETSAIVDINDLYLQKQTPNQPVIKIKKNITANQGIGELEAQDFQFAFRYLYTSGQYSALSAYSEMFKGEKDTSSYEINYDFSGVLTYVKRIESFARVGNNGAWQRIDTRTSEENTTDGNLIWKGAFYEALDFVTANKPFDAIPVNAKHLEVAKNRLFLGNIEDDYDVNDNGKKIQIQTSSGYTPSTSGGTSISYLNASLVTASSSETTAFSPSYGSGYTKPFCNNSTYAIGYAYYDKAMKTRGVEDFQTITTGKFTAPALPDITITAQTGYVKPSWAEYMQVVYTKNLSKIYSYEGYASNIFFRLKKTIKNSETGEDEERVVDVQNLSKDDLNNSPVLVVDLMTMNSGNHRYNYSEGDFISINIKDYATSTEAIYDMQIIGVDLTETSLVLCEYNGGAIQTVGTLGLPEPEKMYFEIYTPRQQQETESYVFYEYGNLININSWVAGSTVTLSGAGALGSKIIGDMVWKTVEGSTYQSKPFFKTYKKATPIEDNLTTNIVTTVTASAATLSLSADSTGQYNYKTKSSEQNLPFSSTFTSNGDSATIEDSQLQLSGFYDAGQQVQGTNKITITSRFRYTYFATLDTTGEDPAGNLIVSLKAQVYRIPFDNELNKRLEAEKVSGELLLYRDIFEETIAETTSSDFVRLAEIDLSTQKDIAANDRFTVKVWAEIQTVQDMQDGAIEFINPASGDFLTFSINGNRIAGEEYTVRDTNAKVNATKTKFLVRAISNTTINQQWNTSAGKTSVSAADIVSTIRTNTIRYSGQYIVGTKINDLNSFFALDSNDLPVENGDIMALHRVSRLQGNGDMLLALCKRESSYILLGEQDLTQASNAPLRALTANFIGTTRNVGGNLGLQEKLSAINYKGTIYWWDDFNKKVVKFSKDGIELLSDKFMRSYFRGKSGSARLCYDPFYNIINVGFTSDSISTGYSEVLERWISDYSFRTDFSESYGDRMILFKGTAVYRSLESNSGTDYNGFLGASQVNSTIKFVMNSQIPVQPLNVSIQHNCNVIDYSQSNGVKASLLTIGIDNENGQASSIVESNFLLENNRLYAHVLRDSNSPNGIIAGDHIVGYINKFLLTLKDKTQPMAINSIDVEVDNISGHS